MAAGDEVVEETELAIRLEAPGEPPPFAPKAASWASVRFFRACQLAIYRDLPAEAMDVELASDFTETRTPEVHYSVDIVMRYLPDLIKLSESASKSDPLVEHLMCWAHNWPLSSVGVSDICTLAIDEFADDASLLQLYADRIMAAGDQTRLSDPRVRAAVRSSFGMFPRIGGKIAKLFEKDHVQESVHD